MCKMTERLLENYDNDSAIKSDYDIFQNNIMDMSSTIPFKRVVDDEESIIIVIHVLFWLTR